MLVFFLIVLSLTPATMMGLGLMWKNNAPKTINMAYGYRTTRSMKSQEAWDFAHKYIAKLWLNAGLVLEVVSIIFLLIFRNHDPNVLGTTVIIITIAQVAGLCLPIIPTEIALKNRFKEDNKR